MKIYDLLDSLKIIAVINVVYKLKIDSETEMVEAYDACNYLADQVENWYVNHTKRRIKELNNYISKLRRIHRSYINNHSDRCNKLIAIYEYAYIFYSYLIQMVINKRN